MFYAQQDGIVTRLLAVLAGNPVTATVKVLTAAELAAIPEQQQFVPAVHVVYDGYAVGDNVALGKIQAVEQNWLVVCASRNPSAKGDPLPAQLDASKIAEVVLGALLGFDPIGTGGTLRLAGSPGPQYDGAYAYLPLNFRLRTTFKGIQ